jgi:phospholipase A-2-activating protein
LRLPYNLSDDPYFTAKKFIDRHELNPTFLDEIAEFIIKNSGSQTIGESSQASSSFDPFTGSGRYVPPPMTTNQMPQSNGKYADPFTGSNSYYSQSQSDNDIIEVTGPETPKPNDKNHNDYYPHKIFINFNQFKIEPIMSKLKELQITLKQTEHNNSIVKNDENLKVIDTLMYNRDENINKSKDQIELLFQMIDVWPSG